MNKRYKKVLTKKIFLAIISIIIIIAAGAGLYIYNKLNYAKFYEGITIDGINISGLSKEQAKQSLIYETDKNFNDASLKLLYGSKAWIIPLESISYDYDFDTSLENAYRIGREGNWLHKLDIIRRVKKSPVNLIIAGKFDEDSLLAKIEKIKKEVDVESKSSTYNYNYGKIIYTKHRIGKHMNLQNNYHLVSSRLLNRNFKDVMLIVDDKKPDITLDEVKDITGTLATYTTKFYKNNYSRSHNIYLACQRINNILIKPGDVFSMNSALGPRTLENGYMEAPVILKNELVPGTGGGVCQVTTTLYNAVLMSMLQVVQRENHSIPLGYVPPGQDATISEGYIDFKFKNNRDYTICIITEVNDNKLTVKIIGKKYESDPRVVLRPSVIEKYEPLPPEYVVDDSIADNVKEVLIKEKEGLKVVLYRQTYNKEGKLINSERISEDEYKPLRAKYAVNKKTYDLLMFNNN